MSDQQTPEEAKKVIEQKIEETKKELFKEKNEEVIEKMQKQIDYLTEKLTEIDLKWRGLQEATRKEEQKGTLDD